MKTLTEVANVVIEQLNYEHIPTIENDEIADMRDGNDILLGSLDLVTYLITSEIENVTLGDNSESIVKDNGDVIADDKLFTSVMYQILELAFND